MALYSATDMAGAGTPIIETLEAGTTYNLALNTGLFNANPNGSNYFTIETTTNSVGTYANVAPKNFNLSTIVLPSNAPTSSLITSPYKLSVVITGDGNSQIVFTPNVTITSGQVMLRSTGNMDLRISEA